MTRPAGMAPEKFPQRSGQRDTRRTPGKGARLAALAEGPRRPAWRSAMHEIEVRTTGSQEASDGVVERVLAGY
jgi:hypothetical protein